MNHGERSAPSVIAQPTTYDRARPKEKEGEKKEKGYTVNLHYNTHKVVNS